MSAENQKSVNFVAGSVASGREFSIKVALGGGQKSASFGEKNGAPGTPSKFAAASRGTSASARRLCRNRKMGASVFQTLAGGGEQWSGVGCQLKANSRLTQSGYVSLGYTR